MPKRNAGTKVGTKDVHINISEETYKRIVDIADYNEVTISKELRDTIEFMYADVSYKDLLHKEELEYLSTVIAPIKDDVLYLKRYRGSGTYADSDYLHIETTNDSFAIPLITSPHMYDRLENNVEYEPKELGL